MTDIQALRDLPVLTVISHTSHTRSNKIEKIVASRFTKYTCEITQKFLFMVHI